MGQTQRLGAGKVSVCGSSSGSASASSLRGVGGERRVGSLKGNRRPRGKGARPSETAMMTKADQSPEGLVAW